MKKNYLISLYIIMCLALVACATKSQTSTNEKVDFHTLSCTETMDLTYATEFHVERYGPYNMITIVDGGRFFLVPEGKQTPYNLPDDVVVLHQPLNRTYLVSTSVMDLIQTIDAISNIRLSGTKETGWYIDEAIQAMKKKKMRYAGKYNTPDYELLLSESCNLAIENTMIYHNPEVKEKLESLHIPVLVERSSYEKHPLGRLEWIKLYGLLFGKEKEADTFYKEQLEHLEPIMNHENHGYSVAFFSITSNGSVNVRKPNDYIAQMIDLTGGRYILNDLINKEENALSTMNMQMEDFYAATKDADILIYNSTIEGEIKSLDDLINLNSLFKEFKALQKGNVYCTNNNFFQKTSEIGKFMMDLHNLFTNIDKKNYSYLNKLR